MKWATAPVLATILCTLLFFSGCIRTSPETPTVTRDGIVITSFYPSLDEVSAGKNLRLTMEIENRGSNATPNVIACVIGPYERSEEAVTQGMWYLKSESCYGATKTLSPFDPESQSGGSARFIWELQAPNLQYPQERTDRFKGRVYYEYSSETTVKVPVYTMSEYLAVKQKGEDFESVEVTKTLAPVDISVSVKEPIIAEDGYFIIKITVTNKGGGVVFDSEGSFGNATASPPDLEDKIGVIRMQYTVPSGLTIDCDNTIEIFKGNSRTVSCEVEIQNPENIKTMKIFPITIKAKYGYYVERETSVKVLGTR